MTGSTDPILAKGFVAPGFEPVAEAFEANFRESEGPRDSKPSAEGTHPGSGVGKCHDVHSMQSGSGDLV